MQLSATPVMIGGEPGGCLDIGDETYGVMAFDLAEDRLQDIRSVVNPDNRHG